MNTVAIQRETNKLEQAIKKASRVLLEFEVAQAKWEKENGLGKKYRSTDLLMRSVTRRSK